MTSSGEGGREFQGWTYRLLTFVFGERHEIEMTKKIPYFSLFFGRGGGVAV